jgi:hypothetical protein
MPTESILFSPEIDERQLDKETDEVNQQLAGVGEDVPVNFDPEEMEMDGLMPAGGGRGGGGFGGAAAGAGLASKIPKPVAGVTAAAAMPIAISGAVGMGMLSAMHGASARMQTSASILGQAWNNVWRPIGDKVDQLFIRDVAMDILEESQSFGEAVRDGDWIDAAFELDQLITEPLDWATYVNPLFWPSHISEFVWDNYISGVNWRQHVPQFNWENVTTALKWSSYVSPLAWSGYVTNLAWDTFVGDVDLGELIEVPDWLRSDAAGDGTESPTDPGTGTDPPPARPRDGLQPGGTDTSPTPGTGTDDSDDEIDWGDPEEVLSRLPVTGPALQSGGRVTGSGVATVHRGELVADPDRLVSELASAVSQASGGGRRRRQMDTSEMERKLDALNRNVRRLANSLSVEGVGAEEIARLSTNGRQERISDRDPTV